VHHILPENLSTFKALYTAFIFLVSTTPSFHIVCKKVLETELEAVNDKEIYLKSDRRKQLVNSGDGIFLLPPTPSGGQCYNCPLFDLDIFVVWFQY
jgi:hypothetical protein